MVGSRMWSCDWASTSSTTKEGYCMCRRGVGGGRAGEPGGLWFSLESVLRILMRERGRTLIIEWSYLLRARPRAFMDGASLHTNLMVVACIPIICQWIPGRLPYC